ncbi:hypothetical protein [Acidovorax soli]|uniref:hypothetical protein n=1 Tax=Acidovorax soli TaxID=592050 RepID=UPI00350E5364
MPDLSTGPNNAAIVDTTIALPRSLVPDVIAEGVAPTPSNVICWPARGASPTRGYLFANPLPTDLLEAFLRPVAP